MVCSVCYYFKAFRSLILVVRTFSMTHLNSSLTLHYRSCINTDDVNDTDDVKDIVPKRNSEK